MKYRFFPAILILTALLASSCSFDFMDDGKDAGESVVWTDEAARYYGTVAGSSFDVEVKKYYRNDVFSYSTEAWIDANGLIYQFRRYDSAGVLVSAAVYTHEATGLTDPEPLWRLHSVTDWAVEAGTLEPGTHTVYGYDSDNLVETKAVYTVSGDTAAAAANAEPDWAARYDLDDSVSPFYEAALWYDEGLSTIALDAVQVYAWLPNADPETDHWSVSVEYRRDGNDNRSVPSRPETDPQEPCTEKSAATDLTPIAGAADPVLTDYFHAELSLAVVDDPSYAVGTLPTVTDLNPASPVLPVSSYGLYVEESDDRNTEILFNDDWYPVSMTREDDRLPDDLKILAEWDDSHRLESKKTYVGSTLALSIEIERDSAGYPTVIETGGEGLAVPLTYNLGYVSGTHNLETIIFSAAGLTQTLKFLYGGTSGVALPVLDDSRSLDPFAFMTSLLDNDLVIQHWNGESTPQLVEYFKMATGTTGTTVTVYDAHLTDDADSDESDDEVNGYYVLAWAADGDPVASFTAYDAGDEEVWSYEYAYGDAIVTALTDAIPSWLVVEADEAYDQVSALYSTAAATTEGAMVQSIATGFLYDMLF